MAQSKTELGDYIHDRINSGILLPDDLVDWIMMKRLLESDCKGGFILDGFPRTKSQSQSLSKAFKIDLVINIKASNETVISRLCGRYMCTSCGEIHNKRWDDVTKCKKCGAKLYQREDDKEAAILKRIDEYHKQFAPVLNFYQESHACEIMNLQSNLEDQPADIYKKFTEQYGKIQRKSH
jgi:adenylate kinase